MADFMMDKIGMEDDINVNGMKPPRDNAMRSRFRRKGRRASGRSLFSSSDAQSVVSAPVQNYDAASRSYYDYRITAVESAAPARARARNSGMSLSGPGESVPPSLSNQADSALISRLKQQGYSTGLAMALASNSNAFHHRIWVVDNSGSMMVGDGRRIVATSSGKITEQRVTRWEEIQETVVYHCQMAALLKTPTVFNLLNSPGVQVGPQRFSVGERGRNVGADIQKATAIMQRARPEGVTPLTAHIWEIENSIRSMATRLRKRGQRIAIILATDGLPTDADGYGGDEITQEFISSLRSLEGLPVWLVIRLCTDQHEVTSFYNNLDSQLELQLEVLDDFLGEAKEVYQHNKWLNYALPMHRCRELGYHDRLFDLIDERPLTIGELRDFCVLLFGVNEAIIPDPYTDWRDFLTFVKDQLKREIEHWNPVKKKVQPWINVKALNKIYGRGTCTIM